MDTTNSLDYTYTYEQEQLLTSSTKQNKLLLHGRNVHGNSRTCTNPELSIQLVENIVTIGSGVERGVLSQTNTLDPRLRLLDYYLQSYRTRI